jgi:hypothetical protein
MAKKIEYVELEKTICDYCEHEARDICHKCKKDICSGHSQYIRFYIFCPTCYLCEKIKEKRKAERSDYRLYLRLKKRFEGKEGA